MTAKQIAVKKYVVKLSDNERERLETLIHAGTRPARQLTRARILLKADTSAVGDGWSDSQIAAALDTSVDTVARTRQQLSEGAEDHPRARQSQHPQAGVTLRSLPCRRGSAFGGAV